MDGAAGTEAMCRLKISFEPYLAHTRLLLPDAKGLAERASHWTWHKRFDHHDGAALFEGLGFSLGTLVDTPDGRKSTKSVIHTSRRAGGGPSCRMAAAWEVAFDVMVIRAILVDNRGQIVDGDACCSCRPALSATASTHRQHCGRHRDEQYRSGDRNCVIGA